MSGEDEKRDAALVETTPEGEVDKRAAELAEAIAKAGSGDAIDSLYDQFKLNDAKKNVFRINKTNSLLDKVLDEATARFEQRPGEMSNKDVLDYLNALQAQKDRSMNALEQAKDIQLTQVNNTVNVNIAGGDTLDRESRSRVIDFVKDLLARSKDTAEDETLVVDATREEKDNGDEN